MPAEAPSITVDLAALQKLTMRELRALRSVLRTTGEILVAFSCQPRFEGRGVNDLLLGLRDFISHYEEAAVDVAEAASPASSADIEARAWTLIGDAADLYNGWEALAPIAVIAVEAVRDAGEAERSERRAAA